jgi:hypothetical protein
MVAASSDCGLRDFPAGRRIADTPRRCHQKLRGTPDRPRRPPPAAIAHGGEPTDLRPPEVCSSSSRRPPRGRSRRCITSEPLPGSAEGTARGPDGSGMVLSLLRSAGSERGDGLPLGTASERCEVPFRSHFWWAQRVPQSDRPPDVGNDSLPDAVVEHLRNDALRSDNFDGFDRRLLPRRSPEHDHRYVHPAPARPRRARCLPNLVGDSRAFGYAFPTRARSLCGLVGEQRARTRLSPTRAGSLG